MISSITTVAGSGQLTNAEVSAQHKHYNAALTVFMRSRWVFVRLFYPHTTGWFGVFWSTPCVSSQLCLPGRAGYFTPGFSVQMKESCPTSTGSSARRRDVFSRRRKQLWWRGEPLFTWSTCPDSSYCTPFLPKQYLFIWQSFLQQLKSWELCF